jgi:hypothetical protein
LLRFAPPSGEAGRSVDERMNYQLLYKDHVIADVTAEDSDFPSFFGKYTLSPELDHIGAMTHVLSYIDYSVRVWPLIEEDRTDEIDYEVENKFIDLIDSEDWWLLDENGEKTGILIPVFCTDNGINWRLDPSR